MDIMDIDILNPEFVRLAAEAKDIYDKKHQASEKFKQLYMKHKAEMAEFDNEALEIKKQLAALAPSEEAAE